MRITLGFFLGCLLVYPSMLRAESTYSEAEILFALKVKPLLANKCFACHGDDPDDLESGLDLTTREGMLYGGFNSIDVLIPGDAEASYLYEVIQWLDPDMEMPPKENDRLSEAETWYFRDWINAGAPWPDDATLAAIREEHQTGIRVATSGGLSEDWDDRAYEPDKLWAYQRMNETGPPPGPHPVDAFLNAAREPLELSTAPPAARATLVRRLHYDLTGLPPSMEAVRAFVEDPAPEAEAAAALVERLLESPHYGEKMAQNWFDVVRYADSAGLANDYTRGNAWRYRDYVVRAFNEGKPYDQFIREQVAGDELGTEDPEDLIAPGMLRMGPWELTAMEVPKVARQRFLDDVTDTLGQAVLAHPMSCARCHDHKFDPVPTRDYYALQAVFATTQLAERAAPFVPEENVSGFAERQFYQRQLDRAKATLNELDAVEEANARAWAEERNLPYIPRPEGLRKGIPEDQLPPKRVGFTIQQYGIERMARKTIQRLSWEMDRYEPFTHSVYSGVTPVLKNVQVPLRIPDNILSEGELEQTRILAGGDPFSPGEPVTPGALSVIHHFVPELAAVDFPESITGRRLALAEWLTHPENPLTARVMVNRIWQWHMGRGLAGNPNNFGATGKPPTHPELLDWLAREFIRSDWSVRHIQHLILTSAAYRQSTRHPDPAQLDSLDPDRQTYSVFQPRRLSAEELRDSMLRVSGELNPEIGGIPVRPEINREAAMQPRLVMGTTAGAWQPSIRPEQRHRRSLYTLKLRGLRDPFFEVFNAPSPDASCEGRDASNVTPQVFSLLNSENSYGRAVAFASRLLEENRDRPGTLVRAFQLAFGREPTPEEVEAALRHWQTMEARHRSLEIPQREYPTEIRREAVEENTGEKFQFTEILDFYAAMEPDREMADLDPRGRGLAEVCLVLFNTNEFAYVY
jgi:hypothetical protein